MCAAFHCSRVLHSSSLTAAPCDVANVDLGEKNNIEHLVEAEFTASKTSWKWIKKNWGFKENSYAPPRTHTTRLLSICAVLFKCLLYFAVLPDVCCSAEPLQVPSRVDKARLRKKTGKFLRLKKRKSGKTNTIAKP